LKKDLSFKKIILLVLLIIIVVGVVLAMILWQQTIEGYGDVTTLSLSERQQNISAPSGGRFGKGSVLVGVSVIHGEPLV
ncbi:hypothetical protein NAI77_10325, partial [Francisella tularensis subsp. holarctica]|nr:hypothetical protein [Francisella tularensis subsp. holarctica]